MTETAWEGRPPLVLIVNERDWAIGSLESILGPEGYAVFRAYTGTKGLEQVQRGHPDLIMVSNNLPDMDGLAFCRRVRSERLAGEAIPILITSTSHATRQLRLDALRAGAWDFLGEPLDSEELILRMGVYLRAKLEGDAIRERSILDEPSGLYNERGLALRTRELASQAYRRDSSLACVVFSPVFNEAEGNADTSEERVTQVMQRFAEALKKWGRTSDAIGRISRTEFAIIAADTDTEGAVKLAERVALLATESARDRTAGEAHRLNIRAGYDAIDRLRDTSLLPDDLLVRATQALRNSAGGGAESWLSHFGPAGGSSN